MVSLKLRILELQLKRAEEEIRRLEGTPVYVPQELRDSPYLQHSKVNSGPEYLNVQCSSWSHEMITKYGTFHNLKDCREIAHKQGLKGIALSFGDQDDN